MTHSSIFLHTDLLDKKLRNILKYLDNNPVDSENLTKYCQNIFEFTNKYPLILDENKNELYLLVYNYWYVQFVYTRHKKNPNPFKESTFRKYFIASTRIIEFVIFLLSNGNRIKPYIHDGNEEVFFKHFKNIEAKQTDKDFAIIKDGKNMVIIFEKQYASRLIIQPAEKSKHENNQITFSFYFKLKDAYVNKIYNFDESKNMIDERNPNGGRWERGQIQTDEEYQQRLLPTGITSAENGEDTLVEANYEAHNRKNKLSTIDLLQGCLALSSEKIDIKKLSKVNLDSSYKRYQINKAVGRAITRSNLNLKSKYTIPEIEVLVDFIMHLAKDSSLSTNIIILTLMTGINAEKIVDALAGFDTQLAFYKQESKFRITSRKKLFGNFDNDEDVVKKTSNEQVEIYVPLVVARVWLESVRMLSDEYKNILEKIIEMNIDDTMKDVESEKNNAAKIHKKVIETFSSNIELIESLNSIRENLKESVTCEVKKYLQNKVVKYKKKIKLSYSILSSIFLHLYKTSQKESDIGILFSGVISKNDEARVCYGATAQRLIKYEDWQKKLLEIYTLDYLLASKYGIKTYPNPKNIEYNQKWYGSKLYFNGTKFNIFLQKLLALSLPNEIDKLNLKFIFIKYALSCLMATRHYTHSTSMEQYSRRLGLIFIQEKGQNLYSGKRIIPLTEQAVELVEAFLSLKIEHNIISYSPCIVSYLKNGNKKEKIMRRGDIEIWFEERRNEDNSDDIEYILKFIKNVPLNFGRHVFTSIALQDSKLPSAYLDAFLGHYKMGTEDQGIYSNFDNRAFYKEIRQMINEIGMEYIPRDWKDTW
jgi:hypothetical protein